MSLSQQTIYRASNEDVLIGPTARFALVGAHAGHGSFGAQHDNSKVSTLISNEFLDVVMRQKANINYIDWSLDSGAFTAYTQGKELCVKRYTEGALRLYQTDPSLTDVFGLDVIGDPAASAVNVKYSWAKGLPVIPTFHYGSSRSILESMAREYPKIALGGCARMNAKKKLAWARSCFGYLWKKGLKTKIHGLGFGERYLDALPFHSVDSTTWEFQTAAFGTWTTFDKTVSPRITRSKPVSLRREIDKVLRLQSKARQLKRKTMLEIHDAVCDRFNVENRLRSLK